jgi:hypothetical protein
MKSHRIPIKSHEITIFSSVFPHFSGISGVPGCPRWHRAREQQDAGDGVGRHQLQQLIVEAQDVAEGPAAG